MELYLHSPVRLHEVHRDNLTKIFCNIVLISELHESRLYNFVSNAFFKMRFIKKHNLEVIQLNYQFLPYFQYTVHLNPSIHVLSLGRTTASFHKIINFPAKFPQV